ncbi:rhamnogalacturonan lyase [Georgenia phoenicis]|uniref:rhamnogalacturonan lyase n=1 Tax=unclassified Georgenia TaxID=2626815 RepID=UPI0039B00B6B
MSHDMRRPARTLLSAGAVAALALGTVSTATAADDGRGPRLEELDRGLVALSTEQGTFLSWRLLGDEVSAYTESGAEAPDFHVHRDGELLATVEDSTNYLDPDGGAAAEYTVEPAEGAGPSESVTPADGGYLELPLQRPADGVTPAGEAYTYSANDMSVGDVDGDGEYEYVVKWDPSNSKDVSQVGYTGNVYVDTYELDGTLLNRIDLGVNIRAGAHYTQFLVYDFDGDGRAEIMLKTAPGTRSYAGGQEDEARYITMPAEDVAAGYAHTDDYRMSAEDYYDHLVGMFRGWHEHPEVVAGRWPATLEEAFGIAPAYDYPLSEADAAALVDHFIDVYAPARSARNALRDFEGFILTGPEYLTVFDGASGRELDTIHYKPGRHDDGLMWGDYAMSRIEPGNRVDRFLATVAYLDGDEASAVFARGYYTRSTLVAYDWDGTSLSERWFVDSGWTPMDNPFNAGPHGTPGTDPEFGSITTQGFHSLSSADVDGDGFQEIVYGSATIDHDGSLLYSSFAELPPESADPGAWAGYGHGDAMHVADIDPDRPGLEIFTVHEGGAWAPYGMAMRQAEDGELIFGTYSGRDTGRGMVGDVVPGSRGLESWASMPGGSGALGLHTPTGEVISEQIPGTNQSIRWAADMTTQIVNGSGDQDVTVDDWTRGTLLAAEGTRTNNGTKGNPSLVADVLGDWREELLVRTADSSAVRLYVSTEVTDRKLHTLMHDPQYRVEVARQQTTYNQPAYPSFYLASDIAWQDVPVPDHRYGPDADPITSVAALRAAVDAHVDSGEVAGPIAQQLAKAAELAERHLEGGRTGPAATALDRFVRHLDNPKRPDTLGEDARADLRGQATALLALIR